MPAPTLRPRFFGLTRFSVAHVGDSAWRTSWGVQREESDYLADLWSPQRMTSHCELFARLCAPQLQAMAGDHDYRHVVLYSPQMPEPWLGHLHAIAHDHPVLELVPVEGVIPSATELAGQRLNGHSRTSGPVVTLRVDDDDMLAVDFLDRLTEFATPSDRGRAVNLSRGFTGVWDDATAQLRDLRPVIKRFSALGQAFVGWFDARSGTLSGLPSEHEPHHKMDQFRPTVHDARQPAFLWTQHLHQDSLFGRTGASAPERIEAQLAKLAPPTAEEVATAYRLFPVLNGRVVLAEAPSRTEEGPTPRQPR